MKVENKPGYDVAFLPPPGKEALRGKGRPNQLGKDHGRHQGTTIGRASPAGRCNQSHDKRMLNRGQRTAGARRKIGGKSPGARLRREIEDQ